MKPEIIAERFVRIHGLLSALEMVASANAERENTNFAGLFVLIGEVDKAARDLEAELTVSARLRQFPERETGTQGDGLVRSMG